MIQRFEDWEGRLAALIESRMNTPFAWGEHDCSTFVIEAVKAMTGVEVFPITWTSKEEAVEVLREAGGIDAAYSQAFGHQPKQNWREMRRGDAGLLFDKGSNAGVICVGERICGPGDNGLSFWPTSAVRCFWRVG